MHKKMLSKRFALHQLDMVMASCPVPGFVADLVCLRVPQHWVKSEKTV